MSAACPLLHIVSSKSLNRSSKSAKLASEVPVHAAPEAVAATILVVIFSISPDNLRPAAVVPDADDP